MAKDKSLKSKPNLSKRNKLSSDDNQVITDQETKVKKKRQNVEVKEALLQIRSVTDSPDGEKCKKKGKKKRIKEETKQTEYPDQSSCSGRTRETDEEEDREQDLSPEEKRVLERKMKKILKKEEKKRLKEEGRTTLTAQVSAPSASQQALDYLTCWAENRSVWKFQKTRQTWLLQHMFDSEKISDEKFLVLLQYLEGLCGQAKDTTVQKALNLVQESRHDPEDSEDQQRAHRAREILQLLS